MTPDIFVSIDLLSSRLIKEIVTFTECSGFLNPARVPPSRFFGNRVSSQNMISFNLSFKSPPMLPALLLAFGSVADSHLFHPRIPKAAIHSVTMLPFMGDWNRAVATMGMALNETTFSHYVFEGGVTFQGTWATPSTSFCFIPGLNVITDCSSGEKQRERWEDEQGGVPLPVYVVPKTVSTGLAAGQPTTAPGQAASSSRGLVGRGNAVVPFNTRSTCFLLHLIVALKLILLYSPSFRLH